jgi:RHS repeat-associated protein
MFFNADSGLYLTNYRAFDPLTGRWLTRDPIGERSDPLANLYAYVVGNPLTRVDPSGLENLLTVGPIKIIANPGPDVATGPGAPIEHTPHHIHIKDKIGPEVRINTEDPTNWKPLEEKDEDIYRSKEGKRIKNFCETLSDAEKKVISEMNKEVFKSGKVTPGSADALKALRGVRGGGGGRVVRPPKGGPD